MSAFELTTVDLESRDIASDCAKIGARIESYRAREAAVDPALIVREQHQPTMPAEHCVPEITASKLTPDSLRAGISEHGALIVRNLFSKTSMDTLIKAADSVIDACSDSTLTPGINTYYNPPGNLRTIMPKKDRELGNTRSFHRESGSAMCVEAPSVAEALLELYEAHGLKDLVGLYLGEPPCLSVKKWVLRRSKLPVAEAGWHQDGAFMGTNLNSLNMWIPLNECGGTTGAPSMDVVPQRLNKIASAAGAQFNWSVSDSQVSSRLADGQSLAPAFNAGDVFFFDHFYLHRTQYRPDFTKLRYAVETWFFGASSFPKNQIPIDW
jgi:hypothetical protein